MDVEDRIRDAVREDRQTEPSPQFQGRVMASIPDRTRGVRWPAPVFADFARFAALAAILAIAFATVGLPLIQSKPGVAAPGGSSPSSTITIGVLATANASTGQTGPFTSTGAMVTKNGSGLAVLLADGRVLVIEGQATEIFDPGTGQFGLTGSMATDRSGETATRLLDGRVLVTGGVGSAEGAPFLASAELYDPKSGVFSPTGSMSTARLHHTATLLPDGRVLLTGGYHTTDVVRLTSEGYGAIGEELASAELYDPKTGKFSPTGAMTTARYSHTAVSLADGRVLVMGGQIGGLNGYEGIPSAEVYDPASGKFSPTGSMPDARQGYSATLLSDGRVLISGGFITAPGRVSGQSEVPTAELYDPTTGQFTQTGAMISPRHWATATRLANGRVLIAGGDTYETYKSVSLAAAELYDPVSGKFSAAGTMTTPREMHFATLLLDGRVLINGGMDITATSAVELNSAEIYQP